MSRIAIRMAALLHLQGVQLTYGSTALLDGAELSVSAGERLCLVGRNGSGKSTLLRIAAGLVEPDGGRRFFQPGTTVRYLPQEPDFADFATVGEYALAGLGPSDDLHRVTYLLGQLGLTGAEKTNEISGGEARRAALARVLAPSPDILLLDEPTDHLDLPVIEWLESELAAMRSAMVLISHDRRFLANLSKVTVWLDRGHTRRLEQGFGQFEASRRRRLAGAGGTRCDKLDRKISMELDWVRYGVSARRKRIKAGSRDLCSCGATAPSSAAWQATSISLPRRPTIPERALSKQRTSQKPLARKKSWRISPFVFCAATGLALSARMVPARPRL